MNGASTVRSPVAGEPMPMGLRAVEQEKGLRGSVSFFFETGVHPCFGFFFLILTHEVGNPVAIFMIFFVKLGGAGNRIVGFILLNFF